MKKILFLLLLMTGSLSQLVAHHIGGYISYKNVSGLTYEISVTTASLPDTTANGDWCTLTLWINATDSIVLPRVNGSTNICSTFPVSTDGETYVFHGIQYKKNVYTGLYTFPAPSGYTLTVEVPYRNDSLVNAGNGSGQQPLYLATSISVSPACPVNSVVCENFQLSFAGLHIPFSYSPAPKNTDGDSLSFELTGTLGESGNVIPGYIDPFFYGISINSRTGLITWPDPSAEGKYVITVKISQFRSGILIGSITNDITIDCQSQGNYSGAFQNASGNWETDDMGNDVLHVEPGTTLYFTMDYASSAPSVLSCVPSGMPDSMLFTAGPTSSSTYTLSATWTPDSSYARLQPYTLNITAENTTGPYSSFNLAKSILVFVDGPASPVCIPVSLEENNITAFSIFPVPAHDRLQCRFSGEASYTSVSLVNMLGQEILVKHLERPVQTIDLDVSQVPAGIYQVVVKKNKTSVSCKKTIIAP